MNAFQMGFRPDGQATRRIRTRRCAARMRREGWWRTSCNGPEWQPHEDGRTLACSRLPGQARNPTARPGFRYPGGIV